MFFGMTSSRIGDCSFRRRQRLRSAIATARLASFWPTMKRSSSETISRGENSVMVGFALGLQALDDEIVVGVDANLGGDPHRASHDRLGVEIGGQKGPRCGQRVIAARADSHRRPAFVALR